jgi:thiol-disulfide isomerase/thioredoxin
MLTRSLTTAAVLALSGLAAAQDKPAAPAQNAPPAKTLTIGDKAPPIDIAHWLKGKQVAAFEPGKVYVMEFWATWCGPCRASMPHISEMQTKYADYGVTVIGVSDEPLPTVVEFLCKTDKGAEVLWNEKIQYTLTTDPDKSVKTDYFTAAGQRGIPCSFIVGKDSRIEWIGHPMGLEEPLDAVVRDSWDRDAFKTRWEKEQAAAREMQAMQGQLREAAQKGDWAAVVKLLDGALARNPGDVNLLMQKFDVLMFQMNQPQDAYVVAGQAIEGSWEQAPALNMIAWNLATDERITARDFALALKAATRANELTGSKDPAILDTLARVHFDMGHLDEAVKWQSLAAENAKEDEMGADIRATLEKYRKEAGGAGSGRPE